MDQQSVTNCGVNLFLIFEDRQTRGTCFLIQKLQNSIKRWLEFFRPPLQWLTIQPSLIVVLDFNLLDFLLKNTEELVSVSHNWKPFVVKSELAEQFINWRNRFTEVTRLNTKKIWSKKFWSLLLCMFSLSCDLYSAISVVIYWFGTLVSYSRGWQTTFFLLLLW